MSNNIELLKVCIGSLGRQSISEDQIAYMKLNNSGNIANIIEE